MHSENGLPSQLCLKMLGSVLEFMKKSGVDEATIKTSFEVSLAALGRRSSDSVVQRRDGLKMGIENLSAELLRLWHRDGRYIDSDAMPRPLALRKGRNSLCATIRRIDPTADVSGVLREMKAVKLIKRTSNGKYLPTSESAIVNSLHPLTINHIAKLVVRLVSTVSRNVDPNSKSLTLIERHAYAPDLIWSEREPFADFTRRQGMAYLESVDNWLEQRRVRRTIRSTPQSERGVAASVHLFAYLDDSEADSRVRSGATVARLSNDGAVKRKLRKPSSKRITSSRATPS